MARRRNDEVTRRSSSVLNDVNRQRAEVMDSSTRKGREDVQEKTSSERGSAQTSLFILFSTFLSAAFIMYLVYKNFPELDEEERKTIVIPKDMDDAKALGKVLSKYKDTYYVQVLVAYFTTYIFLQTFAIPGSIFLSILSGFLYPFPLALFLVCLCSGLGASFCYMLSYLVGRPIVYKYLTEKATKWSQQVLHLHHLWLSKLAQHFTNLQQQEKLFLGIQFLCSCSWQLPPSFQCFSRIN
ncbi:transmembrane protein 41B isoform X2 [Narcine bancroftii]|uniref:transmembrane protein 41B isoform X2 n=1 Tax=Narcine bancroftii TaxID=1343680 RepID=UPI003831DA80